MEAEPMTRQEYIEKMRALLPSADTATTQQWADWLEQQGVPFDAMHSAFYGVHQQYGGELAGLMFMTGPRHYCLYPNEFILAAEYLYGGGTIEQIDERPSHTMGMRQGGY
jgi:hypothetical protein